MTVIKAGQIGTLLTRPRTIDLSDHLREAGSVVEAANRQAAEIIAAAGREAIQIRERVKKAAFAEGRRLGLEEGKRTGYETARSEAAERFANEQASLVSAFQAALAHMDATREDRAIAAERHLLDFSVEVASGLTFAIGRLHREAAVANLRRAIDLVGMKTDMTVHVHPDDLDSMRAFAESTFKQLEASRSVDIVADPMMAPGGCRVDAARTNIDASLEAQVDEMLLLLLGEKRKTDD